MTMDDPYDILGVRRDDTTETIRQAYRKLAKLHHPDLNPGKPEALGRFKAINAANEILSDPEKRGRYDRGEIDGAGNEKPPERPFYRDFHGAGPGERQYGDAHGLSPEDLEALFGAAFASRAAGADYRARGADAHYSLTVGFLDAANGAIRRLTLPEGRTLDVTIPAGLRDGHVLRLKGQGYPGHATSPTGGAPAGDALVEISVAPHRYFRREGNDVLLELPVTLREAILGASVDVPTVAGKVRLSIPPNSANGAKLRLGGRGIAGGHQIVELRVVLPAAPDPALAAFLADWTPETVENPRAEMEAMP
jgi:DnaJ-class molecular chaperone